ncbi:MAG: ABC transporter ATP-binding protein [Flavobacteriales bacterium]|nr:ABC transporter ATP-binding protein [Flavobacteriales bacterium]
MSDTLEVLLNVDALHVHLGGAHVVKDVSLTLHAGETIAIVGASGSGKTVTSLALMGLLPKGDTRTSGRVELCMEKEPVDVLAMPEEQLRRLRGTDMAMVFQEPMTALDPVHTVGDQVKEAIREHLDLSSRAATDHVLQLFHEVRLPGPEQLMHRYPHQLSGGQKQRVVIALALCCDPRVLICDEPTTALDMLVQRDILELLKVLACERRMGLLFITHDLGVVRELADRVLVMHKGEVVEQGSKEALFASPGHPYTRGLLACRPRPGDHPVRLSTVEDHLAGRTGPTRRISRDQRAQRVDRLMQEHPILRVDALDKTYPSRSGIFSRKKPPVQVLRDVSFAVHPGETLGVVGGSGSGKTTLGRSILQLIRPTSGRVRYGDVDLTQADDATMRRMRRELQIIFQDPYASLNPQLTAGRAITEAMRVHRIGNDARDRWHRMIDLLERVGLEEGHADRFPHQFSGGQRQRIVIARALALRPRLIVCDESIAALDVSVQAQVLNLLNDLKEEHGLTYLFISHDLNVVRYMCDRILVLEQGRLVEIGPADEICEHPRAPYTKRLLDAVPGGA